MLKQYLSRLFSDESISYLYLSDADLKSGYDDLNRYYRGITDSITVYCWFLKNRELTVYSNSLSAKQAICARTSFSHDEQSAVHQHSHIELAYIVSGEFHQQIAGRGFCFCEGEIIITNQNTPHCENIDRHDAAVVFLNIQNTMFQALFSENGKTHIPNFISDLLLNKKESYSYLHFTPKAAGSPKTPDILARIVEEIYTKEPGSAHILPGYIIRLFTYLVQEYQFVLKKETKEQLNQLLFSDIEETIRSDYRSITIEKLQDKYHYNADYFNRLIKKFTGRTFVQLRQDIRLENAHWLLAETPMKVDDIARQVGYENLGYFYRIFEEKYRATPGSMR